MCHVVSVQHSRLVAALWLELRGEKNPSLNLCRHVGPWTSSFTLHCSNSLTYMNDYLAIDSGEYLWTNSLCRLIAMWLGTSKKSQDCV